MCLRAELGSTSYGILLACDMSFADLGFRTVRAQGLGIRAVKGCFFAGLGCVFFRA